MGSKRGASTGQRLGSKGGRAAPPPNLLPPPSSLPALNPALNPARSAKRFDWIEGAVGGGGEDVTIKARRPASRTDSRGGSRPVLDASVKSPELKLQLLTRALEESRAKVARLEQDREAVSDALLQLCQPAGGGEGTDVAGNTAGVEGGDPAAGEAGLAGDDGAAALPLRLGMLGDRLAGLREALAAQEMATAEARAAHERAALQVVAQQQRREALEAQLEEARYAAQQQEQAGAAQALKAALLEEQLAAVADSARRRMEEQLDTFRDDALTARTLRTKFSELTEQLDGAKRAQQQEAVERGRLAAQVETLQGRLKEATAKQAELSQQLWDKSAAHNDLTAQHRALQEEGRALSADNQQLRSALAAAQQRAQQAETLGEGLRAECAAGRQLAAALQEEGERLRAELQQEREGSHRLATALAEEQVAGARQRAALQGRDGELASLLLKLDEYQDRIVGAEGQLEAAPREAAAEAGLRTAAEAAAQAARYEAATLRGSLADLAAGEARVRQQLGEAEARLAQAAAAQRELAWRGKQQERAAAAAADHVKLLRATLVEQGAQLEAMAGLQRQVADQQQRIAGLEGELQAAGEQRAAMQAAADELAEAKQQVERALHKQTVLAGRLQEQGASLASQLKAATGELGEARAAAQAAEAGAARQRAEHEAAAAAAEAAHAGRRVRNEQLEHENRQQAIVIAELEAKAISLAARLESTQQHNAALHRFAVAHGAAYGRLAAHSAGLRQQLDRQLSALHQLCRHLGLQLAAALAAADPVAALEAGAGSSSAGDGEDAGTPAEEASQAAPPGAALLAASEARVAAVAAALFSIRALQTELRVAEQLLEMQASSSEAAQLAAVPADVAAALAADLAGLPASLLQSPRLEGSGPAEASSSGSTSQRAAPQLLPPQPPGASAAAGGAAPQQQPPSALCTQVAQMEAGLERLVHSSAEHAARAAAASQLHAQEKEARQRAQDLAVGLSAQLQAVQADLGATRAQRDQLDAQSRRLARELRDAIYSLGQMHAQRQGAATSWAVRGLQSQGAQTQYCELWVANLCGKAGGGGAAGPCCPDGCADGLDGAASGDGSVLCAPQSSAGTAASEDGSPRAVSEAEAVELAAAVDTPAAPARVLPLPALRQQIRDLYQAKALHDIAVARGQRPFLPLADFLACHLALQAGVGGPTVQQRAAQLQTSVAAHAAAGDREVALFGLAAGMLEEAPCGACGCSATGDDSSGGLLVLQPRPGLGGAAASTTAADAVPTVLYHSRRRTGSRAQHELEDALPVLRRYSASAWHAAYLRSAARRPLPQPFDPAGCQQLLPAMAAEIHNLAVGVPGVEQLITWALGSEACPSASLPQLDLGLRLAENQVPQLYLLAVEACRLLGLGGTPQVYVKSSSEAAAYYLLLPSSARLHGLNGGAAPPSGAAAGAPAGAGAGAAGAAGGTPAQPSPPSTASSDGSQGARGLTLHAISSGPEPGSGGSTARSAVAAVEGRDWQCAVVLTSALLDLLEPAELQAVMAGCLAFHAALTSPAGAGLAPGGEATQLAVLCRSMAALASLGALAALCPEALLQRLPPAMAPFFASRIQPVLRRCLRYLALFGDRVAAAALGGWRPVAAAAVKQAAGAAVLRDELNLDAVLEQARALEGAAASLLPQALLREEAATVAGAGASLALLRVRELQKWSCGAGGAAAQ